MLPGRPLAPRSLSGNEIEELGENFRFERIAGLRAAQYRRNLRRHEGIVARPGRTLGTRTSKACHFQNGARVARRKSIRRLEPERRTQDDDKRLFAARQGAADSLDAGDLGRGRELLEEKECEAPCLPVGQGPAARGEKG